MRGAIVIIALPFSGVLLTTEASGTVVVAEIIEISVVAHFEILTLAFSMKYPVFCRMRNADCCCQSLGRAYIATKAFRHP